MTYRVALSFEDGVTRFITCVADQTVAEASYRARINIPLDCRDGACGTCKAFCESGEYDGGAYIDDALTAAEAEAGYVLPCSMKPKSDLVLQIATTSELAKTQSSTYTGTITALDRLSSTTVGLTVEVPNRDKLAFLPGQYVNIAVPGTDQSRSYSFSNAPGDKELTFLVKLTPGGMMSEYLTERAAIGNAISFAGPNGSFFLRDAQEPVLLLAGGTGLAPILAILRALRESGSARKAHLLYGVSTDDDLVELDTIGELSSQLGNFTWDYCVSDPHSGAPNKGYVTSLIGNEHQHDDNVSVYLCGPPAMVESVRTHFANVGIEPTGFYYEKFALSGTATEANSHDSAAADGKDGEEAEPEAESFVLQAVPIADQIEEVTVAVASGAGRAIAGQEMFAPSFTRPLGATVTVSDDSSARRSIAGQRIWPTTGGRTGGPDAGEPIRPAGAARGILGQELLRPPNDVEPLVTSKSPVGEQQWPTFTSPGRFDGKVVVVTGAAQGIGAHTARRIGAEGGTVVLVDRSKVVADVASELHRAGGRGEAVTVDLETWDGAQHMVSRTLARYGRIDVLINNVGGAINFKPFTEFSAAEIHTEITRSLMTTLLCCRAALPGMVDRGHGVIVNISSVATRGVHRIPYSAAKGGVNALTASLAMEYADKGIRVVATAPGGTAAPPRRISRGGRPPESEQERKWFQAHIDQTLDSSLMHRYGTLDEQVAAIAFLASDEAAYITGTVLPVGGGDMG
ncbi:benzoate 1,2-dioxygenase electron transfer component BenC [Nocardia sp. CA-151230]|uniref:benzoate 1,2-dioxygenase electron transfer component BenC n=1 Tax=Nocardia sp. CA-151230 TaxID=3239982 RepID=UPI003D93BF7F